MKVFFGWRGLVMHGKRRVDLSQEVEERQNG
jgi:hypothetical protein